MSKSLGNFYRVIDLEKKGYDPLVLRYLFLTAHYKTQLNFTWKALEGALKALEVFRTQILLCHSDPPAGGEESRQNEVFNSFKKRYIDAVNNDLNMPQALAIAWEVVNSQLHNNEKYELLINFDKIFGLNLEKAKINKKEMIIPEEIAKLAQKREQFRKEKKWQEADQVRQELIKNGFLIEDTSTGSKVKKLS